MCLSEAAASPAKGPSQGWHVVMRPGAGAMCNSEKKKPEGNIKRLSSLSTRKLFSDKLPTQKTFETSLGSPLEVQIKALFSSSGGYVPADAPAVSPVFPCTVHCPSVTDLLWLQLRCLAMPQALTWLLLAPSLIGTISRHQAVP